MSLTFIGTSDSLTGTTVRVPSTDQSGITSLLDTLEVSQLANRIIVSTNSTYTTVKDAVDYFNASATADTEILVDAGDWYVDDTISVENEYNLHIRGLSSSLTRLNAAAGLTGKPMFQLKSACDIDNIYLDGSTLTNYGTLSGENCIEFITNSGVSYEIQNVGINGFYIGVVDYISADLWMFNFDISECHIGHQVENDSTYVSLNHVEVGNFENGNIGI